ncbi:MAG: HIT family protein [Candidatus Micrarchaeota archaeon]
MEIGEKMAAAIRASAYLCEGINMFLAYGEAAGQEILPLHLHVYPRFKGDGSGFRYDKRHFRDMDRPELDEIAQEIRKPLIGCETWDPRRRTRDRKPKTGNPGRQTVMAEASPSTGTWPAATR